MTPEQLFVELIKRPEADVLDFKQEMYDFNGSAKYAIVKDVIAMANTPRGVSAYIVLGVAWEADKPADLKGLPSQVDDSKILDQLNASRILPVPPAVRYHPVEHNGKKFGILEIPPEPKVGPFFSASDVADAGLYRDTLYTRIGSKNERAAGHQQKRIWQWFSDAPNLDATDSQQWARVLDATESLNESRAYLLVCDRLDASVHKAVAELGGLPWVGVIDCDPDSEVSGVLMACREPWGHHRSIIMSVKGQRHPIHPRVQVTWFFARGLAGRAGTEVEANRNKWLTAYGRELDQVLDQFATAVSPTPVTVLVLWQTAATAWMIEKILDSTTEAFGESANTVVVSRDARLEAAGTERGAVVIGMDVTTFSGGVSHVLARRRMPTEAFAIPTSTGAPCALDDRDRLWLEEECELVHLDAANQGPDGPEAFRRGASATWRDFDHHYDCDRSVTDDLTDRVRKDLESRLTSRINVFHPAGAGGTTVARRVAWAMHSRFPTVLLRSTSGTKTASRMAKLASVAKSPILCVIDSSLLRDSEIDELFRLVRSDQTAVVFLQVTRRFQKPKMQSAAGLPLRTFWLDLFLDPAEADRFRAAYSLAVPSRQSRFQSLSTSNDPRERTAFYFGLTAYGREFGGLNSYVAARLADLTDLQRKSLAFLSMAHHYGQQGLPEQSFAQMFAVPRDRSINLGKYLPKETMELLVSTDGTGFRTAHNLIAEEILQQLLRPSDETNPAAWRQQLSHWAISFAEFLRSDTQLPAEQLIDLASRVFVLRDNSEIIGTESSADRRFSRILEDIQSSAGQRSVLESLTKLFPDEPHFHAHYGRYLGLIGEVDESLAEVTRAIDLSPDDPILHHMCGMAYRYKMRALISEDREISEVVAMARQAQESFETSREKNSENEHAYVSEIQTICQAMDYAAKQAKLDRTEAIIKSSDSFVREGLQQAEDLMDQLRDLRGGDRPSNFEMDCRARLDLFYGDESKALQGWQSVLDRPGSVKPPIRKQIVFTLLHRVEEDWSKMHRKDIERCKELLRANVEESSVDSTSMRLWLRAVRFGDNQPSLSALIERASYWRSNEGSLDATYYLYVLHTLAALEGSIVSLDDSRRALEDCRKLARGRRNRNWSFEWLGKGKGISALVHHSALGEWSEEFYSQTQMLLRLQGRVSSLTAAQQGEIELPHRLTAFFVPAKADLQPGRDENALVECFLGFSYDGLRAWQVSRRK
ncbi:5'-methylthioadenosine/S-adenosylhomocysteine nucleosidase [soil metagenome]